MMSFLLKIRIRRAAPPPLSQWKQSHQTGSPNVLQTSQKVKLQRVMFLFCSSDIITEPQSLITLLINWKSTINTVTCTKLTCPCIITSIHLKTWTIVSLFVFSHDWFSEQKLHKINCFGIFFSYVGAVVGVHSRVSNISLWKVHL